MFKRRSANHPTTPKIASVALPETFSPPINISYTLDYTGRGRDRNSSSANRSTSSFFNRFRSSPALSSGSNDSRSQSRTGYDSPSHAGYGAGYQNQPTRGSRPRGASDATTASDSTSDEDEGEPDGDGVVYKQILPNVVAIREFKNLTREERMELKMEEKKVIELARKHPNARITLVKSKARIEEEQEREEEELKRRQRERERDDRRAREREYNELQARAKQKSAEDDDPFARRAAREARRAAEEEERRRQKEHREMEDSKKKAQERFKAEQAMRQAMLEANQREALEEQHQRRSRRQSSSQPHQPQPTSRPIKGILKPANGPTTPAPPMTFGGGPSPEPEEEMDNGYASSHQPRTHAQNFARRNSVQVQPNYHSDTEQYRSTLSRGQRSHTFSHGAPQPPSHPQRANTYPIDPRSSPWTQPPSSYPQPPRDSSRSRSGSGSHSRSRSGSHSQIEADVQTDSELAQATYNSMVNRNHSRQNTSSRTRNASFSGPPPGMCPPVPPMAGFGPMPPIPSPTIPHQPHTSSSRYMKPYRKPESPPQQARWWFPPDSYTPGHVHIPDSVNWEAPPLPWTLSDHTTRVVDAKHPPQPVVFFDLAFDPRMREYEVRCMRPGEGRLTSLTRDEETKLAAGMMSMPTMIIVSDMYPTWTVVVHATKGNTCRVCEVFRAIYDTYAVPLTQQELSMIPPSKMPGVMAAFEQRCKDGPGLPPVEMAKGPKRVDLLRSERFFKGLEYVAIEGLPINLWKLKLEKISR